MSHVDWPLYSGCGSLGLRRYFSLTNLMATLDLALGNLIASLPLEIAQLTNLRELNLSGNQLDSLPLEILELPYLKRLDLRGNPLPDTIRHRLRRNPATYLARHKADLVGRSLPQ